MQFAAREIPDPLGVTAVHDGVHRSAIKTTSSHTGKRPDWGLIGTAIDFRLRYAFTTGEMVPPSARYGAARLTANHPGASALVEELAAATAAVFRDADQRAGERIELAESLETDLVRLCVVAAQLDQLYRAYPFVIDKTPLLDEMGSLVSLDQACAQVPWFVIDQIHEQVLRANTGLGSLRNGASRAIAGISFSGSDLVGGADADLLVDGLLLDFKSTHAATTIGRSDVYQLAGYTLLDFDDDYRINRVGVYWTRHGVLRTFTVPVFFKLLGATQSVAELRTQLRGELAADAERRQRMYAARTREGQQVTTDASATPRADIRLRRSVRWIRRVLGGEGASERIDG